MLAGIGEFSVGIAACLKNRATLTGHLSLFKCKTKNVGPGGLV